MAKKRKVKMKLGGDKTVYKQGQPVEEEVA